jgi:hypothetical protein
MEWSFLFPNITEVDWFEDSAEPHRHILQKPYSMSLEYACASQQWHTQGGY